MLQKKEAVSMRTNTYNLQLLHCKNSHSVSQFFSRFDDTVRLFFSYSYYLCFEQVNLKYRTQALLQQTNLLKHKTNKQKRRLILLYLINCFS